MKRFLIPVIVVAALALAGCTDKATEQFNDAPRGSNNDEKADTMSFPDGYSNVAHKCDGPNMVYSAFKGDANRSAVAVVPNDPRCSSSPG